jgi:hypothetical protein
VLGQGDHEDIELEQLSDQPSPPIRSLSMGSL